MADEIFHTTVIFPEENSEKDYRTTSTYCGNPPPPSLKGFTPFFRDTPGPGLKLFPPSTLQSERSLPDTSPMRATCQNFSNSFPLRGARVPRTHPLIPLQPHSGDSPRVPVHSLEEPIRPHSGFLGDVDKPL